MNNCNYCAAEVQPMVNLGNRPIVNDLSDAKNKNCRQYTIEMTICRYCGLHQLIHQIDSEAFYTDYMTPSHWKNEPHILKLVEEISTIANPQDPIMDIGCNDGKFLLALQDYGFTKLHGIEPTINTANAAIKAGFEVKNSYFDIELANSLVQENGEYSVVITRQVLEHIKDIKGFLISARALLRANGFLVIEVPDSEINFKHSDYGVWEEHLNYFTEKSLTRILTEMGWEIDKWYRSTFSGWCQTLIARPARSLQESENQIGRSNVSAEVKEFEAWVSEFENFKTQVSDKINHLVGKTGRVGLFGVGSRSISTLYSLGLIDRLCAAYDDSKEKIGRYIPGTGIQIGPSSSIDEDGIELVLLGVNFENELKVLPKINDKKVKVRSILPPSQILLWGDPI